MRMRLYYKDVFLTLSMICCSVLCSSAGEIYNGIPNFKVYMPREYNAGMQNNDLVQDQRGMIYIANNYGLLEFDGTNWQVYPVSNGTKVRSVAVHPSGRIFVGAQNQFGYFFPNATGQLSYTSVSDSLPETRRSIDEVWNTYIIDGNVYFCTIRQIFKYDGSTISEISTENNIINTVLVNGQLFVQVVDKGISILKGEELIWLNGSQGFTNNRLAGLIPYSRNQMLAAFESKGLYLYTGSSFKKWDMPAAGLLSHAVIGAMIQLTSNEIAIGTRNEGLYLITNDGQIKSHFYKTNGFNNRDILGLMEDDYGNLWVGQNNGLAKIETSSPFTFINERGGLQGAGYCSFSNASGLFLGTNNGLFKYNKTPEGTLADYNLTQVLQGQVYSITELDKQLLIGHDQGAMLWDGNAVQRISDISGAWRFLRPNQGQHFLIEGNYSGFQAYEYISGSWTSLGKIEGLDESSRVFEQELDGTLWMTHGYKGVYKLTLSEDLKKFESIRFYGVEDGFRTNQLINVFKINNELIFCSGEGIYRYNSSSDRFELHPVFTEIFGEDAHVREMEEDAYGNVYFISREFAGVLQKDRFGSYELSHRIFNKIHDQLNDDLEDVTVVDFNNVLFGAHEGFIHYDAQKNTNLLNPINLLIRKVIATNSDSILFAGSFVTNSEVSLAQAPDASTAYSFDLNSIHFEFSCTFADVNNRYSYKLAGFDKEWSEWTTNTGKEYTNLHEGKYEFQVRAKNIYDTVSSVSTFRFTILPPWYRTRWAFLAYFVLIGSTILGMLMSQSARHKREKKVMTLQQKRELIKRDNEMVEMSEKSNAEIIKLKNEKLQLEINTKNKELASSTMNLIDKNQLLSGLKSDLKTILTEDKRTSNGKALRDMIKKIDRSISHDDEWEHFQQYFDQVHGDFTSRLRDAFSNLSPQEVKLSAYLRMNLSTKEIAQLMNITTRGVEIARYRLRKKLNLSRDVNLTEYIGRF